MPTPTNTPTSKCCDHGFNWKPERKLWVCKFCGYTKERLKMKAPCHTPTTDSKNSSGKCEKKDGLMICYCGKCEPDDYDLPSDMQVDFIQHIKISPTKNTTPNSSGDWVPIVRLLATDADAEDKEKIISFIQSQIQQAEARGVEKGLEIAREERHYD